MIIDSDMRARWKTYAVERCQKRGIGIYDIRTMTRARKWARDLGMVEEGRRIGATDANIESALKRIFPAALPKGGVPDVLVIEGMALVMMETALELVTKDGRKLVLISARRDRRKGGWEWLGLGRRGRGPWRTAGEALEAGALALNWKKTL